MARARRRDRQHRCRLRAPSRAGRRSTRGASSGPWTRPRAWRRRTRVRAARRRARACGAGRPYAEYAGEPWVEAESVRLTELRAVARERLLAARLQLGDAALLVRRPRGAGRRGPAARGTVAALVLALYRAQRQADALSRAAPGPHDPGRRAGRRPGTRPARARGRGARAVAGAGRAATARVDHDRPPAAPAAGRGAVGRTSSTVTGSRRRCGARSTTWPAGTRAACWSRARPASARPGCSSRPPGWPTARAASACCRRGGASWSGPSASAPSGSCSSRASATPARREALLGGAAAGARGGVRGRRRRRSRSSDGCFAVLHGLYWLTVNLAAEGPLRDLRRRRAVVRQRLAALPRLPRQAARGAAGAGRAGTLRTGEQHARRRRCSPRSPSTRRSTVVRPGSAVARGGGALVRERSARARESFVERLPPDDRGQPAAAAPAAARAGGRGSPARRRRTSTPCARSGSRAVSALVTLRLRRMPTAVTAVGAGGRRARRGAPGCRRSRRWRSCPRSDAAAALDALSRSEILHRRAPARLRPPARPRGGLRRPARRRARAPPRAGRRDPAAAGRAARAGRGPPPAGAAPRATPTPWRCCARGADRGRPGVPRTPRSSCCAGRSTSRPAATGADVLRRARAGRDAGRRPGRGRAPGRGLRPARRRRASARRDRPWSIARTHVFVSPARAWRPRSPREAAAALPAELDDERQGLVALQRISGFMHGLRRGYRPARPRRSSGDGRRCPDARPRPWPTSCSATARTGRGPSSCARFALEGDRLLAVDNGLLWIVAANVLLLADDDLGDFWDRALARAHATGGAVRRAVGEPVARLHAVAPRPARRRAAVAGRRDRAATHVGHLRRRATYAAAFTLGVQLDRGDLAAARRSLEAARGAAVGRRGRPAAAARRAARLLARARAGRTRRSTLLDRPSTTPTVANPAWAPWRGLKAQALAASAATTRRWRCWTRRWSCCARWGAAAVARAASLRLLGELHGAAGAGDLREAVTLLAGDAAGPGAGPRPARPRALARRSRDDEAVPLLPRPLDTARACGARAVAREAARGAGRPRARAGRRAGPCRSGSTSRQRRVSDLAGAGPRRQRGRAAAVPDPRHRACRPRVDARQASA